MPRCPLCGGGGGSVLYADLPDRLFDAQGRWSHRRCSSRECGLVWLDPMPRPDDIHLAYRRYYTHAPARERAGLVEGLLGAAKRGYLANVYGYRATPAERLAGLLPWIYPGRPSELDFSVMWLPASRRGRLLDVGAGSGWLVEQMNALGWRAEGLDFDAEAIARARARGLTMHAGGLLTHEFPPETYDAVTMSHSIEHVHEPGRWLAEVRRILRPGGTLVVATPNSDSLLHRRFGAYWFPLDPPRHLQIFNRRSLERALSGAGFCEWTVFSSVRDANNVWIRSRSIRRTGRFDMLGAIPRGAKIAGRALQLLELMAGLVRADAGEDLVALARRDAGS